MVTYLWFGIQDGYTALAVAVQQGHERVIAELVNTGQPVLNGDVSATSGGGGVGSGGGGGGTLPSRGGRSSQRSPPALHVAARKDDVNAAKNLLQNVLSSGQPAEVLCVWFHFLYLRLWLSRFAELKFGLSTHNVVEKWHDIAESFVWAETPV